jgi:hypothetical protein
MSWRNSLSPDIVVAGAYGALSLTLYLSTMCPVIFWYDSGEYVVGCATLGIVHPPGHPLYMLLGRLFTLVFPDPVIAVHLMSAVSGAAAIALFYVVVRMMSAGRTAATLGALALALSPLFWSQTAIAEVYTPLISIMLLGLALLLYSSRHGNRQLLIAAVYIIGLGFGVHMSIATTGIGFVVLFFFLKREYPKPIEPGSRNQPEFVKQRIRDGMLASLAFMVGITTYLYVPVRLSAGPEMNVLGLQVSWDQLTWYFSGGHYRHWFLHEYDVAVRALQIAWILLDEIGVQGLIMGAVGAGALILRRPILAIALISMIVGNVSFFFGYNVHDIGLFFLPSVTILFCLYAVGIESVFAILNRRVRSTMARPLTVLFCAVLLLITLEDAHKGYDAMDLSSYTAPLDYGEELCLRLPPNSVIVNYTTPPEWIRDSVFTHYFQKILQRRRDVYVFTFPSSAQIRALLNAHVPVFAFAHSDSLTRFELKGEGELYHLTEESSDH